MRKIILLAALGLAACGAPTEKVSPQEKAKAQEQQKSLLNQEIRRFVREDTTVVCISGAQYLAWIDQGDEVKVHHLVPLFSMVNSSYVAGCTGGDIRDLDHPATKDLDRGRDTSGVRR
jgi:hypothetical protein